MTKQRILVLIGLPGCGKSTWAADQRLNALSSDELRRLLRDDAADQTIHRVVFATLRRLLRTRIELGCAINCVDATNLTARERRAYIKIGEYYGCDVEAVYFDVPVEICQERNRTRTRVVPAEALAMLAARLEPPRLAEGFSRITVVSTGAAPPATPPPEAAG